MNLDLTQESKNNMMPDKIYLNKYMLRRGMLYPAHPPADVPEKEYIRKDVLLDKLNLALKLRGDGDPNSDGVQTIKAMINYIESL